MKKKEEKPEKEMTIEELAAKELVEESRKQIEVNYAVIKMTCNVFKELLIMKYWLMDYYW